MSKITNVRLPNAVSGTYDPQQVNQLIRSLEQVILQLNSTYTPITSEDKLTELDWFTGAMGMANRGVLEDYGDFAYGSFVDYTTQSASIVDTPTAIVWGTTAYSKHISIGSPTSRIVFSKPGRYYLSFTAELHSESANTKTFYFWPRINGVDIPGSTMINTVHNNDQRKTVARAGIFQVNKGDYLEAMFAVDNLDADLHGLAATAFCPATPSVTITILGVDYG